MRHLAVAAAAAAALLLAGCTATPAASKTQMPAPSRTPACIVGAWQAGADELQKLYDLIPAALDYPAATLGPQASVTVDFTEAGAFTFAQSVPATLEWEGHAAAVELGGTLEGAYTTAGDGLTLKGTSNALTAQPADDAAASKLFAAATQETLTAWPVTASGYTCGGDRLVLDLATEGHAAAVAFTRR